MLNIENTKTIILTSEQWDAIELEIGRAHV